MLYSTAKGGGGTILRDDPKDPLTPGAPVDPVDNEPIDTDMVVDHNTALVPCPDGVEESTVLCLFLDVTPKRKKGDRRTNEQKLKLSDNLTSRAAHRS